jgi:hypothetical protein
MVGEDEKISRQEVEAFADKLNGWAQGLPENEKALMNIIISDARFCPKDPRCCPDVTIEDNIEEAVVGALESTIGYGRAKRDEDKLFWSRTTGMS